MKKLKVGELLNQAYDSFIEEDYSLSKEFCERAIRQDINNLQAKAFNSYVLRHKGNNGRYSKFSNHKIYSYIAEIINDDKIREKTIVIDLMLYELQRNGRDGNSQLYVDDMNEVLNLIKTEEFSELFANIIELLEDWKIKTEFAIRKNEEDNYNKTNTNYNTGEYSNKKTLREKLGLWFFLLLPFMIILLPGYIIVQFIINSSKK